MFIIANGIKDKEQQRALLLSQAGSRLREKFWQLSDTGDNSEYELAKTKLTEYFEPQKYRRYEVYEFRETQQQQSEQ